MEHDRAVLFAVLANIGRVKPFGQIEVHLQRAALPVAANSVAQYEFQLRAIKRALPGINAIWQTSSFQGVAQSRFGFIPDVIITDARFWSV